MNEYIYLKPVSVDDASFISKIRSSVLLNKYLSSTKEVSVNEQINWINNFLKEKKDFYFIIQSDQKQYGTVSIYNIDSNLNRAEFGRYICIDPIRAIQGELLILKYAFEILKLNELYCRTIIDNEKVWKQHYKFGFIDSSIDYHTDGRLLKVQKINWEEYNNFDYSTIYELIDRLCSRD